MDCIEYNNVPYTNATMGVDNEDSEQKMEENLKKLSKCDFIRLYSPDMNGLLLSRLIPRRHARQMLINGFGVHASIMTRGPQFESLLMPDLHQRDGEDGYLVPDMQTLRFHPLTIEHTSDVTENQPPHCEHVGSILCEIRKRDGSWLQSHPRTVARQLLEQLSTRHNMQIFTGFEPEFRMFLSEGFMDACERPAMASRTISTLRPATHGPDVYRQVALSPLEPFLTELDTRLKDVGIDVQDYIHEYGSGQLESPLMPSFGLEAADSYFLFRQILREVANNHNMCPSFMAVPLKGESGNGCHFNHSLWDLSGSCNMMYDSSGTHNLSKIAKNWIGGIVSHMPALVALCSPTVNCYRRVHKRNTPIHVDWDISNRASSLRVKNADESRTYIENRLPSSTSCPYHVMAAILAAGMDGLDRELEPPPPGIQVSNESGPLRLPSTLQQAIEALTKDTVLCERLGRPFIDCFIRVKELGDLRNLAQVDLSDTSEEMFTRERQVYLAYT